MKFIILFLSLSFCMLHASTINIAVAANVSYAMQELKKEFNKTHPNIHVRVTLGSSGKLTAQIKNGAPYGLFMSANMKYPKSLYKDNLAITKPIVYAQGSLAYLSAKKQDFSQNMKLLKNPNIHKIAIANPKTAPYGKAAVEAMKNAKVYNDVKKKFVYAESISQTVAYTITAANLGFVAKSSLYSPKMKRFKKDINWSDVNPKLYTPINQGIVILKNAKGNKDIKAFYDFIFSKQARQIFKNYGYALP